MRRAHPLVAVRRWLAFRTQWCGWSDCVSAHFWREDGGPTKEPADLTLASVRLCRGAPR